MNLRTINDKELLADKIRITEPVILFNPKVNIIATHVVTKDQIGRIDLVAQEFYNNVNDFELILKYNNISNPFSINEGDVLQIPDNKLPLNKYDPIRNINNNETSNLDISKQFIQDKRLTKKDQKRVEYLKRKAAQKKNGSNQILPPNLIKPGDKNIIIGDGVKNANNQNNNGQNANNQNDNGQNSKIGGGRGAGINKSNDNTLPPNLIKPDNKKINVKNGKIDINGTK